MNQTISTSTGERDAVTSIFWEFDPATVKLKKYISDLEAALLELDSLAAHLEHADNMRLSRKTAHASFETRSKILDKFDFESSTIKPARKPRGHRASPHS